MKQILYPDLTSARILTPLELNGIHFSNARVVITPQELHNEASKPADS